MYKPPEVFTSFSSTRQGSIQRMIDYSHSEVREESHRPKWCILCSEEFPGGGATREQNSLVRDVITFAHWRVLKRRCQHLGLGKPLCGAGPGLDGLFRILISRAQCRTTASEPCFDLLKCLDNLNSDDSCMKCAEKPKLNLVLAFTEYFIASL